jgi:hypothetical protein
VYLEPPFSVNPGCTLGSLRDKHFIVGFIGWLWICMN